MFRTIFSRRGTAMWFVLLNSFIKAGTISLLYRSFNLVAISISSLLLMRLWVGRLQRVLLYSLLDSAEKPPTTVARWPRRTSCRRDGAGRLLTPGGPRA